MPAERKEQGRRDSLKQEKQGRGADGHHPVQLRLGGYPAGAGDVRTGELRRGDPYHHGSEYRHLRNGAHIIAALSVQYLIFGTEKLIFFS